MLNTTLGYLEKDGAYLMLHRTKKKNDINQDKWIGIGGKLEARETVLDCIKRECLEETGLVWEDPQLRAIITFNYQKQKEDSIFSELMFLFSGSRFHGSLKPCDEGELVWVKKEDLFQLPLWEGDRYFLERLDRESSLYYMQLDYVGDQLTFVKIDETVIKDDR